MIMNDEQIMERCSAWLRRHNLTDCDGVTGTIIDADLLHATASLYREAIAEGLERAAEECIRESARSSTSADKLACGYLREHCWEEARKIIKEAP